MQFYLLMKLVKLARPIIQYIDKKAKSGKVFPSLIPHGSNNIATDQRLRRYPQHLHMLCYYPQYSQ